MLGDQQVAGLLASRICHDLVSPVGALENGTDLIREIGNGDVRDEVMMIGQSAARASALLQFYRVAFGSTPNDEAVLSESEIRRNADRMIATDKIFLEWRQPAGQPMTRPRAQLFYLLLMCGRAVLGMRGSLDVDVSTTGRITVTVQPEGLTPSSPGQVNQELLSHLENKPEPDCLTPRLVEFALVHKSAEDARARIMVERQVDGVEIVAA